MRFSQRVNDLPPSQRREIRQLAAARGDVVDLGRGDPDFPTPPSVLEFVRGNLGDRFTHYSPPEGLVELRTALAERLAGEWGESVDPREELIITAGAQEAISAAMATLVGPGDEVVTFSPCYGSIAAAAHLAGAVLVRVPLREEDGFLPDPGALEAHLGPRSRLLVSVSPHNPTGRVWPEERLRALGECARRRDLLVLSDEIYAGLTFDGLRHRPMATLPGLRPRTITVGGFSKTYAMTGWRVGFLAGPAPVVRKVLQVHYHLVHCASGVSQLAALGALERADNDVAEIRHTLQARRDVLWEALEQVSGLRCVRPDGSLFAFPALPETGMSSLDFARFLVSEVGLAVVPGTEFGPEGEGYIRLSLTAPAATLREGVGRLAQALALISAAGPTSPARRGPAGAAAAPQGNPGVK
jgi:aspartate/methionine/tyrosine aminotransferase